MHTHEDKLVHGDLRAVRCRDPFIDPQNDSTDWPTQKNVLVKGGNAYLTDFGITDIVDGVHGFTTEPHGNVRWMAHERLVDEADKGELPLAAKTTYSDIYSLGSLILEVKRASFQMPVVY